MLQSVINLIYHSAAPCSIPIMMQQFLPVVSSGTCSCMVSLKRMWFQLQHPRGQLYCSS